MRNFEERMDEIRHRSHSRIRARKQRMTRLVTACVPLVLCLCIGAVLLSGGRTVPGSETVAASLAAQYPRVTVTVNGVAQSCGGEEVLTQVEEHLKDVFRSGKNLIATHTYSNTAPAVDTASYTIALYIDEDTRTYYTLRGYTLVDHAAQEEYGLTKSQRTSLLRILGLNERRN